MIHIKPFQALENLTRFLFQVDDCQAIAVLPRLLINKERSGFASPLEQAHFRYSH